MASSLNLNHEIFKSGLVIVTMASPYKTDLSEYLDKIKSRAIDAFLDDLGDGDVTTSALFKKDADAQAKIVAEEECVVAGIIEARHIFESAGLNVIGKDGGSEVSEGELVMQVSGSLKEILARERICLNYLSRMSGIATYSRKLSDTYGARILFLRKTDPALLFSEKLAVSLGGCLPHRMNLSDAILIKDNHLDELEKRISKSEALPRIAAIGKAISLAAKTRKENMAIEIEVETRDEAKAAAEHLLAVAPPKIIMLDNVPFPNISQIVKTIKKIDSAIVVEASGGITADLIEQYLASGADYVSTSSFLNAKTVPFKLALTSD